MCRDATGSDHPFFPTKLFEGVSSLAGLPAPLSHGSVVAHTEEISRIHPQLLSVFYLVCRLGLLLAYIPPFVFQLHENATS